MRGRPERGGGLRSSLSLYLSEIRRTGGLSRADEQRIATAARTSREALDRLVEANLGFVISIAREFQGRGLALEDLISEGNLGLIEAASRFEPERGHKFITYGVWWIRKAIRRGLAEQAALVRVTEYHRRKLHEMGPPDDVRYTARSRNLHLAPGEPRGREATGQPSRSISLDRAISEDGETTLADFLVSPDVDPETEVSRRMASRCVKRALSSLPPRKKSILTFRFGLSDDAPMSLREVAERLSLSRERVRQIERDAIGHIRRMCVDGRRAGRGPR